MRQVGAAYVSAFTDDTLPSQASHLSDALAAANRDLVSVVP